MPERQRSVVVLYFKTGSRFESREENGLSHFLEHMVFRGTKDHQSAHLLSTAFEELGGTLDASTAADHGTFGIDIPHENLDQVLPLIAEVFRAPLIHDLEIERGIIREEVLEDLGDDGELIDPASLSRRLTFGETGLGRLITGPLDNVDHFTEAQLRAHHERTYIANDMVISIAGPSPTDQVLKQLSACFSSLKSGTSLRSESPPEQSTPQFLPVSHRGSSQTSVALTYRCPGRTHSSEPALEMLLRVIDDGMATRLYHRLCDSQGLCYSVGGSFEVYEDVGLVEFEADAAHERAPLVLAEMLRLTSELRGTLISEAELKRTQKRARWQQESYLDEVGLTADFLGHAEFTSTARTPSLRLDELLAVSREDIRQAAEKVFSPAGRGVVCVGGTNKAQTNSLEELALSKD